LNNLKKATFFTHIRANDWFYSFVPLIFGHLYLWIFILQISISLNTLLNLFLSLVTTVGIAGLGYFINEYFDIEDDTRAKKNNKLAILGSLYRLVVLFVLLLCSIIPWLFLPTNGMTFSLLSLQCVLYIIYSVKPFRFKRVPLLSNLIDTLYAYVIPLLLSFHTFLLISPKVFSITFITCYALLMFVVGFRNIFIHQIVDVFNDKRIGNITLPRRIGVYKSNVFLLSCLLIEMLLFLFVILELMNYNEMIALLFIPYSYIVLLGSFNFYKSESKIFVYKPLRNFTDVIYQFWFPTVLLIILAIQQPIWIVGLIFHISLFTSFVRFNSLFNSFYNISSQVINHSIFYLFLILGVNLKKERLSAIQYLKTKFDDK